MLGVFINVLTVLIGSSVGLLLKKGIPSRVSQAVMTGLGACTLYIGISGSLSGENVLILIAAIVLGIIVGTLLDIDGSINKLAAKVEVRFKKDGKSVSVAEGIITATLLFCVGSMTVTGSIQAGLNKPFKTVDIFGWFVEKATEIGFDELTPLCCRYSERKVIKPERIEKILVSAAKQSLKAYVPRLNPMITAKEFIGNSSFLIPHSSLFIAHCYDQPKQHLFTTTLIDAEQAALGDMAGGLGLIVMHSKIFAAYKKLALVEYDKYVINGAIKQDVQLPTIGGKHVLVTDYYTIDTSVSGFPVYKTYLFGEGAFLSADKKNYENQYTTEYDPETSAGIDMFYTKQGKVLHPNGLSLAVDNIAAESPTFAELGNKANYALKFNHKNVKMGLIKSNG